MHRATNKSYNPLVAKPSPTFALKQSHSCPAFRKCNSVLAAFLLERQQLCRDAAVVRKGRNDLDGAKGYLLQAHGFDQMIDAACRGLPVCLSGIPPVPPSMTPDFTPTVDPAYEDFYDTECQLLNQLKLCYSMTECFVKNDQHKELTTVFGLVETCRGHLVKLRGAYDSGASMPMIEYEVKTLPSIQTRKDVGSREIEVEVRKAYNLKRSASILPKSYEVEIRYPFPPKGKAKVTTSAVQGGHCSLLNFSTKFIFSRNSSSVRERIRFEAIKFDILRKSPLRKNKSVGSCELKLDAFETSCELHDILEVHNGFAKTGILLEVSARIRNPIGAPDPDHTTELKWITLP